MPLQAKMQMVNKNMAAITKNLEKALASNNLEKIASTMQQFEKQVGVAITQPM